MTITIVTVLLVLELPVNGLFEAGFFHLTLCLRRLFMLLHVAVIFFFFCPCLAACRILVPQPGIELMSPEVGARSLNHWTAREVLIILFYCCIVF